MRQRILALSLFLSLIAALSGFSQTALAGPKVEFKTSQGNFVIELDADKAPKTVNNFLSYVKSGFYNGTIFHRVINGFMIQGGGFTADMNEKPTQPPVVSEAQNGLKNQIYTIAMARTADPDSASAQFFINVKDNPALDYPNARGNGYAVFGKVISGNDTIDKIKQVPTGSRGRYGDVPINTVTIESATLLK